MKPIAELPSVSIKFAGTHLYVYPKAQHNDPVQVSNLEWDHSFQSPPHEPLGHHASHLIQSSISQLEFSHLTAQGWKTSDSRELSWWPEVEHQGVRLSHVFNSLACAIQPEVQDFRSSNQNFPGWQAFRPLVKGTKTLGTRVSSQRKTH